MSPRTRWSRALVILGLAAALFGAIDPLEGSVVILPGMLVLCVGAWLGGLGSRRSLLAALLLAALGIGAMFALSAIGGIGGRSGRSMWWALILLPYPVGWVMGLVGAVRALMQLFRRRATVEPSAR